MLPAALNAPFNINWIPINQKLKAIYFKIFHHNAITSGSFGTKTEIRAGAVKYMIIHKNVNNPKPIRLLTFVISSAL
ncbi:MAG: hypothetical protein ACPHY8_05820 [Patescibacteria group bacterium]